MNIFSLSVLLIFVPLTASAYKKATDYLINNQGHFGLSLGEISGKAGEYVYIGEDKISQINWKFSAPVIEGDISYHLSPWLTAGFRGWTTFTKSVDSMDDYDWINPYDRKDITHRSYSQAELKYANELDMYAKGWVLDRPNYKFAAVFGYSRTSMKWVSHGGTFDYTVFPGSGLRVTGKLPDRIGVDYRQTFHVPYLGMIGQWKLNRLNISGLIKYSQIVRASLEDNHHLRSLQWQAKSFGSKFYSISLGLEYLFAKQSMIFGDLTHTVYSHAKGNRTVSHDGWKYSFHSWESQEGFSNKSNKIAVGYRHLF